jgi:hypothetical protein
MVFEKDKSLRTAQLTSLSVQLTSLTALLNDQRCLTLINNSFFS